MHYCGDLGDLLMLAIIDANGSRGQCIKSMLQSFVSVAMEVLLLRHKMASQPVAMIRGTANYWDLTLEFGAKNKISQLLPSQSSSNYTRFSCPYFPFPIPGSVLSCQTFVRTFCYY